MGTGSPNARPELVNILVQHRIDAMNADTRRPRQPPRPETVAALAACDCSGRPQVSEDTEFRRYTCTCQRRWTYRTTAGWTRVG